jgi:hypothetical protein
LRDVQAALFAVLRDAELHGGEAQLAETALISRFSSLRADFARRREIEPTRIRLRHIPAMLVSQNSVTSQYQIR